MPQYIFEAGAAVVGGFAVTGGAVIDALTVNGVAITGNGGGVGGIAYTPSSVAITGGTIASVQQFVPVTSTYTAAGAIALTDIKAVVSNVTAGTTLAMTLANGAANGQRITIKRYGPGVVTVTATIDKASSVVLTMNTANAPYESYDLSWDAANATWMVN